MYIAIAHWRKPTPNTFDPFYERTIKRCITADLSRSYGCAANSSSPSSLATAWTLKLG
jgi:hypothetical protein